MIRKKLLALTLSIFTCLTFLTPLDVQATGLNNTKIKLKSLYIQIPYSQSNVSIKREETDNSVEVTVRDKNTGEILDTYGEIMDKPKNNEKKRTKSIDSNTYTTCVYKTKKAGPVKAKLSSKIEISTCGSFRQINRVIRTWWNRGNSGPWTIENSHADTISKRHCGFPTDLIEVSSDATIEIETENKIGGSFSMECLESAGFTIEASSSSKFYARKDIYLAFNYSLY